MQMMTAGRNIKQGEYNPSRGAGSHCLPTWVQPLLNGLRPSYLQQRCETDQKHHRWRQMAGPDKQTGVVGLDQYVRSFSTLVDPRHRRESIVLRVRTHGCTLPQAKSSSSGQNVGQDMRLQRTNRQRCNLKEM
jgi:hypothetical protein